MHSRIPVASEPGIAASGLDFPDHLGSVWLAGVEYESLGLRRHAMPAPYALTGVFGSRPSIPSPIQQSVRQSRRSQPPMNLGRRLGTEAGPTIPTLFYPNSAKRRAFTPLKIEDRRALSWEGVGTHPRVPDHGFRMLRGRMPFVARTSRLEGHYRRSGGRISIQRSRDGWSDRCSSASRRRGPPRRPRRFGRPVTEGVPSRRAGRSISSSGCGVCRPRETVSANEPIRP